VTAVGGWTKRNALSGLVDPRMMTPDQLADEARSLLAADERNRRRWRCDRPGCDGLPHRGFLHHHARATQLPPDWSWDTWLIMSGRGFGKTRTGAETCREWGAGRPLHICVMGETYTKVRDLCFEHPTSGLLAVIPSEQQRRYVKALGATRLDLANGTVFRAFSAERPDAPRGYAFDAAWVDEYAAMPTSVAQEALDNIWFALREADQPRVIITTTPKARPHVVRLVKDWRQQEAGRDDPARPGGIAVTTGTMRDNLPNLSAQAVKVLEDKYVGTRLGRQELSGELLEDNPGAIWQLWMFEVEGFRLEPISVPQLTRRVLAIDPSASVGEGSDLTAYVVAARDGGNSIRFPEDDRPRGYVLHAEEINALPEARARKASELFWRYQCDAVVVEANKGGDWIPAVIRLVDPRIPVQLVHATDGKRTRAEPVSSLYEQMRVSHVGPPRMFDKLEQQMTEWTGDPSEDSPDLMDALVWAMWALFIESGVQEAHVSRARDGRLTGRR
jgi:phage terminase large subunit-like protein